MAVQPLIAFINESTVVGDAEAQAVLPALRTQVTRDFEPRWNADCDLEWSQPGQAPADAWQLVVLDDSDQAGALGYHDLTSAGLPLAKVFARSDAQNNLTWSVTASHELLEMLADPDINTCAQTADTTFVALEVADACESESFAYDVDGVLVSDFVTPHWFVPGSSGPFDFGGHVAAPQQLLAGGYIGVWTPSSGWTQRTAAGDGPPGEQAPREASPPGSRRERRMRGRWRWERSTR